MKSVEFDKGLDKIHAFYGNGASSDIDTSATQSKLNHEQKNICDICDLPFYNRCTLENHMVTNHEGRKLINAIHVNRNSFQNGD